MCAVGDLAAAEIDELLSSLVDKSLLQPLADGTRLRMLETIREYGAEQLAGRGEAGELRRRHAAHYTALMREAAPKLLTRDQLSWLAPLRADRDNILAALRYWCDAGEADNALGLAVSLSIMALLLGNDTDMAEWTGEALAVPGEADPGLRAIAEAVHVVTSVMDPEGAQREGTDPGLVERLDALDIEKYPIAGLLRPVYAVFAKDDERVRGYLDQARAGQDEWLAAAAWMMAAGLAENDGNLAEMRSAAAEARGPVPRARRTLGPVHRAADHRQRRCCSTATWTAPIAAYTEAGRLLSGARAPRGPVPGPAPARRDRRQAGRPGQGP